MKVDLISVPENTLRTIYTACRTCYSADYPINIFDNTKETESEKMLKLVNKVLESGHHSTIEHCQFVFSISGVSRACTHQLVRHRHMQFSQKSQRYVTEKKQFKYVTPKSIQDPEILEFYENHMILSQRLYNVMILKGIPAEDARFVLPNAATSSMVASLNLRELIHLANLRLCNKAQWEIRAVVQFMCNLVIDKEPWLKEYLQPKCYKDKKCNEIKGCGRHGKEL